MGRKKESKNNSYLYPSIPSLCKCGCGEVVWNGNKWKRGHITKINPCKMMGKDNPFFGKHHTKETKDRMSKNGKGKNKGIPRPQDVKDKISKTKKGIKKTEIQRENLSKAKRGKYCGELNPNFGNHKLRGKNNPNWRGGLSSVYCEKWTLKLREEIRKRDNYICQHPDCLITQLESLVLYGRILNVHHVHYDKKNCYPDLVTLCVKHNFKANYNRESHEQLYMKILEKRNLLNYFGNLK